ncbi:MAG TPA: peptide chain release factor 1 [Thermoanaerobaculia bacterium]|nr:peptide chain release factor 1 [Thermoanaerobaculia bacterium]
MLEKLARLKATHEELTAKLADPATLADPKLYTKTTKALAEISSVVSRYDQLDSAERQLRETREMLATLNKEDELFEMATLEETELAERVARLEAELRQELAPKDPNDERNVVLEIRAGTGGDEASLFAAELFKMYSRYAENQGWDVEIIDLSESEVGGVKEVSAIIEGRGAYSRLKYEGGVHRVQRVPETEASGRIHTSAVTVAVLPEAEDVEVEIDEKDLRIDTFCASGPGGQGVNTTYSAVRITHLPTNTVVSCQDERSQIKNRAKALRVLKSRLLEVERERAESELSAERKRMVGSGDRSEKIRTYNFPQNRITDHRIGLTVHQLQKVMLGDLDPMIQPLSAHFEAQRIEEAARGTAA